MKTKSLIVSLLLLLSFSIKAQNTFVTIVKDSATHESMIGVAAAVESINQSATSDASGLITIKNIPDGKQQIVFYFIGYRKTTLTLEFPLTSEKTTTVYLASSETDLEEVTVSTTRTNSHIDDLPTKVEVLGQEDMDEESTIVPGNITSILGDLSIITIQRTNAINGNDAIRMQGLDAKYTQIMRDGLPLYGGFSGSLGVLAIPPLDLKQVEIIKGSASTLYGGGAIGGLINFISKAPSDSTQATITLNATSIGEGNLNAFISGKKKKTGLTLFAGANVKQAVDINGDGFTEVPQDQNYTIHPRFFFKPSDKTEIVVGLSSNYDKRKGGDIYAIKNQADSTHPFFQTETLFRNSLDLTLTEHFSKNNSVCIKTAGSSFQREANYSGFHFNGTQYSSYSEINDVLLLKKHTLVAGLNFISESFILNKSDSLQLKSYNYFTSGVFVQDDWQAFKKLSFQLGIRYDIHNTFGNFFLPRVSLFYKPGPKFTFRLAGGSGYKTPNIFDVAEPSAKIENRTTNVKSENSYGANADINYHTILFDALIVEVNQAFYYTTILNPIILGSDTTGISFTKNGNYSVESYGTDTYVRLAFHDIELYLGYNHTEATQQYDSIHLNMPFNPKDKFSTTLAYEIEGKWRMGIEAAYTGNQYVYNNRKVANFLFMAAMVERKFKRGSLILNCENLLDVRQTQFEPTVIGTRQNPTFQPLWAPTEGRVINLSVKIKI